MHGVSTPVQRGMAPPPAKKSHKGWIIAGVVGFVLFLMCGVGLIAALNNASDSIEPIPGQPGASSENIFHYGQTATVGKFAVTIAPVDYTPNGSAAGYTGGKTSAFQVTIRNDSSSPIDLFSVMISGTIDGGQPAEKIYDTSGGIEGVPSGELFPTESATFKIAFDDTVSRVKIGGFLDFSDPVYFVP